MERKEKNIQKGVHVLFLYQYFIPIGNPKKMNPFAICLRIYKWGWERKI
jgi:hypothetical protein